MREYVLNWMYGMLCSGALCCVLLYVCPPGKIRELLETGTVCVMLLAFISPLQQWRNSYEDLVKSFAMQQEVFEQELFVSGEKLRESLIAAEYAAYICNEAEAAGLTLQAAEIATAPDESGNPIPREIRYYTEQTIPVWFQEQIAAQLGVAVERQYTYEKQTESVAGG